MEENLPDKDHLDDFVQKSFDGYEENPSSDMWSRIAAGLEVPPPAPPAAVGPLSAGVVPGWVGWLASSVLCLVVAFSLMYHYYNHKIDHLESALQKQQQAALEQTLSKEVETLVNKRIEQIIASEHQKKHQKSPENFPFSLYSGTEKKAGASIEKNGTDIVNEQYAHRKEGIPHVTTASVVHKSDGVAAASGNYENNKVSNEESVNSASAAAAVAEGLTQQNAIGTQQQESRGTAADTTITLPFPALQALSKSRLAPLWSAQSAPVLLFPVSPLIKVHRPSPKWYAGVRIAPVVTRETAVEAPQRPVERPRPGRPTRTVPVFINEERSIARSMEWGMAAGRKIHRQWGLETGLYYTLVEQKAEHTPRFEFKHGNPLGGGPHGRPAFNFDYNLNTYSGTAEVSVRMEQSNPNNPVGLTELVHLTITTEERTKLLKVPLLVTYTFGKGRLKATLKAGTEAQYLLSNRIDIASLQSDNTKLEIEKGNRPQPSFETQERLRWGYRAAAGLSYRMTRNWSFTAEPVLSGSFSTNTTEQQKLPGMFFAGINTGINYHF
jgi:hypothetical protein